MFKLTIGNKPAVIQSGTAIKLTRENPFFAGSGDYTLDVTLPLAGCPENLRIFGALHRDETSLLPYIGKRYNFHLLADSLSTEGTAVVQSVSGGEVKLQLLGGRSALNNALPDDVYIDELDLGFFQEGRLPDPEAHHIVIDLDPENPTRRGMAQFYHYMATEQGTLAQEWREQFMYGTYGHTDGPCFPIFSPTSDALMNYEFDRPTYDHGEIVTHHWVPMAPQPWLMTVVEKVMASLGYTFHVVGGENHRWAFQIFLANSRATTKIAEALPHWTLREFITEVENFLSAVFLVAGHHVTMRFRSEFYNDIHERVPIEGATDEHTAEVQESQTAQNTQGGNVDYDWETEDKQMRLPDEVWEQAIIQDYDTIDELSAAAEALDADVKSQSRYIFRLRNSSIAYAHLLDASDTDPDTRWKLVRVDYMPPLIRKSDTREIDLKLRILPALLTMNELDTRHGYDPNAGGDADFRRRLPFPVLMTSDIVLTTAPYYSVNAAINPSEGQTEIETERGESSTDEKKNLMLIAVWKNEGGSHKTTYTYKDPGGTEHTVNVPTSVKAYTPDETGIIEDLCIDRDPEALRLTNTTEGIGRELNTAPQIEFRAQRKFQFTDKHLEDVTKIYLVHGRIYACQKIELTIDEHGIQPLKTGYFYEIG